MHLDRLDADREHFCDFSVRAPFGDELDHGLLSSRQRSLDRFLEQKALKERLRYLAGEEGLVSPTTKAPGFRRLAVRPETDHPFSRTRSTGEVGNSECRGKATPKGRRVLRTCPSRSCRISHEPSGMA